MGARLYDPTTTTFLSPDPLTPPAGALWANNPYDYANNNPLTLTDPLRDPPRHRRSTSRPDPPHRHTRTLRRQLRQHTRASHHRSDQPLVDRPQRPDPVSRIHRRSFSYRSRYCCVSDRCWWPLWSCNHLRSPFRRWLDGGHRKVHHRHVNWRDVVVSGLVGGFTNGFGSWVSKTALLTKNAGQTVAGLRAMAGVNAFTGSVGSTISYTLSPGPKSLRGYAGALISGGVAGGLDGMAGPATGSISRNLSKESSPFTEKVIERTIGFGALASGSVINSPVSGEHVSLADIGKTSVVDQAVSSAGSRLFPGQHGVESIESSRFGVRSLHGVIKPTGKNARRLWAESAGGAALGIGTNYLLDTSSETSQR